jgi:hypothetical protein
VGTRTKQPRSVPLLSVTVGSDESPEIKPEQSERVAPGLMINIEIPSCASISLAGAVDARIVWAVLESPRG